MRITTDGIALHLPMRWFLMFCVAPQGRVVTSVAAGAEHTVVATSDGEVGTAAELATIDSHHHPADYAVQPCVNSRHNSRVAVWHLQASPAATSRVRDLE